MGTEVCFRYAKRGDTALILSFIRKLAEYEKMHFVGKHPEGYITH